MNFFILTETPLIEQFDILFGILIVGFLFFGLKSGARMFVFAAGVLSLFLGFAFLEQSLMLFLAMLGVFMTITVYTFFGGNLK